MQIDDGQETQASEAGRAVAPLSEAAVRRVFARMEELGIRSQSALARKAGIRARSDVNMLLLRQRPPSLRMATRIARALGWTVEQLLDANGPLESERAGESSSGEPALVGPVGQYNVVGTADELRAPGAVPLPVYAHGKCGDPRNPEDAPVPDYEEYPPVGRERVVGPRGFGVIADGTSMEGARIHNGNICWVNPDRPARPGDVVCAHIRDGEGFYRGNVIKRYLRVRNQEDGTTQDCLASHYAGQIPQVELCANFTLVGTVVAVVSVHTPT